MKHLILLAALAAISAVPSVATYLVPPAHAQAAAHIVTRSHVPAATGQSTTTAVGIITPDVAVGFATYTEFTRFSNGNMGVCARKYPSGYSAETSCKASTWVPIQQVVPAERTYVGFRVIHRGSDRTHIEVWWK